MSWVLANATLNSEAMECKVMVIENRGSFFYTFVLGRDILRQAGIDLMDKVAVYVGDGEDLGKCLVMSHNGTRSLNAKKRSSKSARLRIVTTVFPFHHTKTLSFADMQWRLVDNVLEDPEAALAIELVLPETFRGAAGNRERLAQRPVDLGDYNPFDDRSGASKPTEQRPEAQASHEPSQASNSGEVHVQAGERPAPPAQYAQERREAVEGPLSTSRTPWPGAVIPDGGWTIDNLPNSVLDLWRVLSQLIPGDGARISNAKITQDSTQGVNGLSARLGMLEDLELIARSGSRRSRAIAVLVRPPAEETAADEPELEDEEEPDEEAPAEQLAADLAGAHEEQHRAGLAKAIEELEAREPEEAPERRPPGHSPGRPQTVFRKHPDPDARAQPIDMGPASYVDIPALDDGETKLLRIMLNSPRWGRWPVPTIARQFDVVDPDAAYWRRQLVKKGYIERRGGPVEYEFRPVRDLKGSPLGATA